MSRGLRLPRLERYLLRELALPFVLTFVVASVLLVSGEFLREIVDKWLNRGLSPEIAARVMLYLLPPLVVYTLPVALLLSVLIAFGRLSEDHEIVALQAAGISWKRLFAPALLSGLVGALVSGWLTNVVVPRIRYESRDFLVRIMLSHPTLLLEAQTWIREVEGMQVWVGAIDDEKGELQDLRIYRDDGQGGKQSITAASGRIDVPEGSQDILLELRDGTIHQTNAADPTMYDLLQFKSIRIPFPVYALARWRARADGIKNSEKSFGRLVQDLRAALAAGAPTRSLWSELGERTAMPFACLTFVFIGTPLSIRPHKAYRAYGAFVCLTLVLAFYLLLSLGEALSRQGAVHPLVGVWAPNLLLGGGGLVAMVRLWRR